ncbi:MAG: hypothetical protein PHE89_05875 [Alphaproteobacteria bacterium]|nr:hypothetical protein [Alphaproteobacteria bacterium]
MASRALFIETAKNFPLSAEHFKFGNASEASIFKIKQYERIEKALLEKTSLAHINSLLGKKDIDLILQYRKKGFILDEIGLLCREMSLSTAIEDLILKGNAKLDNASAEIIGFRPVSKKIFDTPKNIKRIIRCDANGRIPLPDHREHSLLFIINNAYNNPQNIYTNINYHQKNSSRKKEKGAKKPSFWNKCFFEDVDFFKLNPKMQSILFKVPESTRVHQKFDSRNFNAFIRYLATKTHNYRPQDYHLESSIIWQKYYQKFENFESIEERIKGELAKQKIIPQIVKTMNFADFEYVIHKSSPQNSEQAFEGAIQKRVKQIMKNKRNYNTVKKYFLTCNLSKKDVQEKLFLMKTEGRLCNLLSIHHINHVSNALEHNNISDLNDERNLVLVSTFMHNLIHSSDTHMNEDTISMLTPLPGTFDMMLGVTPMFQTPFTGKGKKKINTKTPLRYKHIHGGNKTPKQIVLVPFYNKKAKSR